MANGKNSFVLYCDLIHQIDHLTNEEKGILFQHLLEYVNDMNPILEDRVLIGVWKPLQMSLKRDLKKYEKYIEKQKANGKKGGRPKTQKTQPFFEKPKKADSVNDNDNDITTKADIEEYILEISKSTTYLEGIYRLHGLKNGSISKLLNLFKEHLKVFPKDHNNLSDFKQHFASWVALKISKGDLKTYQKQTKGQL